jgi:hypothetical protein
MIAMMMVDGGVGTTANGNRRITRHFISCHTTSSISAIVQTAFFASLFGDRITVTHNEEVESA